MVGDCIAGQRAYDDGYVQGRADAQDDRDASNMLALCRGELASAKARIAEVEAELAECKAKLAAAEAAKENA